MITAAAMTVTLLTIGAASAAGAATPGGVSGTVTAPAGVDVGDADIRVIAYETDAYPDRSGSALVQADGSYTISGLEAGEYKILFFASSQLATEWWNDAGTLAEAATVTVADGATRTGVDAFLDVESTIEGVLGFPAGTVVSDLSLYAYAYSIADPDHAVTSDFVSDDGTFTLTGLRPGSYKIKYTSYDYGTSRANNVVSRQWQGGSYDFASASVITIPSPGTQLELAHTLSAGRSISGTVTGTWGAGDHVLVIAADANGDGMDTVLSSDGSYVVDGLTPGAYKVSFAINWGTNGWWSGADRLEWWNDAATAAEAAWIDLSSATSRSSVDANLDRIDGRSVIPTITGTPIVGARLTASPGAWPAVPLSYQWLADGNAISGATSSTYTVARAQAGKRISVRVNGDTEERFTQWRSSAPTLRAALAPVPTISGTAKVGRKLTAVTGTWVSGTTFTYRWLANGKPISSATKSSFTVGAAQRGAKISVVVTGRKSGYPTVAKTSTATAKAAAGTLVAATPKIVGTTKVGKKLTARPGTWTAGTTLSYRWYANGKPISKATRSTFTLTSAQRGKKITVQVTGKKSGYTSTTRTSKPTAKIS